MTHPVDEDQAPPPPQWRGVGAGCLVVLAVLVLLIVLVVWVLPQFVVRGVADAPG